MDSSAPAVAMCNTAAYSKFSYCKNISVWLLSKADVRICVNVYLCTKIVAHFRKRPTYEMPTLKYETNSCRTDPQKMIGNITGIHITVYKQNDNLLHCTKKNQRKIEEDPTKINK